MMRGYSARVDALLDRLGSDLTETDFRMLAIACADQGGATIAEQEKIATILGWAPNETVPR